MLCEPRAAPPVDGHAQTPTWLIIPDMTTVARARRRRLGLPALGGRLAVLRRATPRPRGSPPQRALAGTGLSAADVAGRGTRSPRRRSCGSCARCATCSARSAPRWAQRYDGLDLRGVRLRAARRAARCSTRWPSRCASSTSATPSPCRAPRSWRGGRRRARRPSACPPTYAASCVRARHRRRCARVLDSARARAASVRRACVRRRRRDLTFGADQLDRPLPERSAAAPGAGRTGVRRHRRAPAAPAPGSPRTCGC